MDDRHAKGGATSPPSSASLPHPHPLWATDACARQCAARHKRVRKAKVKEIFSAMSQVPFAAADRRSMRCRASPLLYDL